jgi:hypothetical protein
MNSITHEPGPRITVACKVHFKTGGTGRKRLAAGATPEPPATQRGHVPRLARLMALAIHFDGLICKGVVRDYADIARLGHVTRARATQIMNLLNLAPDIQEAILFLPRTVVGQDSISERHVRLIVGEPVWGKQRRMWHGITTGKAHSHQH